jgi:hypothetical protein
LALQRSDLLRSIAQLRRSHSGLSIRGVQLLAGRCSEGMGVLKAPQLLSQLRNGRLVFAFLGEHRSADGLQLRCQKNTGHSENQRTDPPMQLGRRAAWDATNQSINQTRPHLSCSGGLACLGVRRLGPGSVRVQVFGAQLQPHVLHSSMCGRGVTLQITSN